MKVKNRKCNEILITTLRYLINKPVVGLVFTGIAAYFERRILCQM